MGLKRRLRRLCIPGIYARVRPSRSYNNESDWQFPGENISDDSDMKLDVRSPLVRSGQLSVPGCPILICVMVEHGAAVLAASARSAS